MTIDPGKPDTFKQIEDFGKAKNRWFKKFLVLPFGIPSHDTFGRVFALLDPKEFQRCFINWVEAVQEVDGDHGRIEIRKFWTVSNINWLYGKDHWDGRK